MDYFSSDEEALEKWREFYRTVAKDLAALRSQLLFKSLSNQKTEDSSPFNEKQKTKWLAEANELVKHFMSLRSGHLKFYKDLLASSSKLDSLEGKKRTDDEIVGLMTEVRHTLDDLKSHAKRLLTRPAVKEISDPVENKVRVIAFIDFSEYFDNSFLVESYDLYGLPIL